MRKKRKKATFIAAVERAPNRRLLSALEYFAKPYKTWTKRAAGSHSGGGLGSFWAAFWVVLG